MNGLSDLSISAFDTFAMARDFMLTAAPDPQHPRLVVVAFVDKWSPPAMRLAMDIEALRTGNDVRFAQLFVVDAAQAHTTREQLSDVPHEATRPMLGAAASTAGSVPGREPEALV